MSTTKEAQLTIRMHDACYQGQYQLAEHEQSFKRLLPYPCQLLRWQIHHKEDQTRIAKIASHLHGLSHLTKCFINTTPTIAHAKSHELCGKDCDVIDRWLVKTLRLHLLFVLQKRAKQGLDFMPY